MKQCEISDQILRGWIWFQTLLVLVTRLYQLYVTVGLHFQLKNELNNVFPTGRQLSGCSNPYLHQPVIENGLRKFEACFIFWPVHQLLKIRNVPFQRNCKNTRNLMWMEFTTAWPMVIGKNSCAAFSNAHHLEPACLEVPQDKSLSLTWAQWQRHGSSLRIHKWMLLGTKKP